MKRSASGSIGGRAGADAWMVAGTLLAKPPGAGPPPTRAMKRAMMSCSCGVMAALLGSLARGLLDARARGSFARRDQGSGGKKARALPWTRWGRRPQTPILFGSEAGIGTLTITKTYGVARARIMWPPLVLSPTFASGM